MTSLRGTLDNIIALMGTPSESDQFQGFPEVILSCFPPCLKNFLKVWNVLILEETGMQQPHSGKYQITEKKMGKTRSSERQGESKQGEYKEEKRGSSENRGVPVPKLRGRVEMNFPLIL